MRAKILFYGLTIVFVTSTIEGYTQGRDSGRSAAIGGRAKRSLGGGVRRETPGLTSRRKQTIVKQVIDGVSNEKPKTESRKRQVDGFTRRLSLRVPIRVNGGQGVSRIDNIQAWGFKWSSIWKQTSFPPLPGTRPTQQGGGQQGGGQQGGCQQGGGQKGR